MRNLMNLSISLALILVCHGAHAAGNEVNSINHQNLSKRPYQKAAAESEKSKDHFEGATMIDEAAEADKKFHTIRLNMLGKRPYVEKNTN